MTTDLITPPPMERAILAISELMMRRSENGLSRPSIELVESAAKNWSLEDEYEEMLSFLCMAVMDIFDPDGRDIEY